MAHELSTNKRTQKVEMAFTGNTPWHGLGQSVTKGASIEVWQDEAGMLWEAREATLSYKPKIDSYPKVGIVTNDTHKLLYRSDTGEELGIVGAGYNIVQPKEVLEFFRDLVEDEGWHIQTAGVLRQGKKLWAMAGRDDIKDQVVKGDAISGRLLLATSLDGSMRTHCALVSECVVCANTLEVAMTEGGRVRHEVSHRTIFNPRALKRKMGLVESAWESFMAQTKKMAAFHVPDDMALDVLRKVFGAPTVTEAVDLSWLGQDAVESEEEDARENRNVERALELWTGDARGADHFGRDGTAWGLLNAVTELVDHEIGRSRDTGLDSAWFGRGKDFKNAAFKELQLITA